MTEEIQEHSTRSPSGAHAWRRCAGKINAERGLPDRAGIEAAEGTLFHEIAEKCLLEGISPFDMPFGVEQVIAGHVVSYNQEMAEHLATGLEYLQTFIEEGCSVYVETRVQIEDYTLEEGGFGTSDICIVYPYRRKILVWDWKYGKIAVSPIENDQEELYGLGCWETFAGEVFDWDPVGVAVEFVIYQPRVPGGGGSWSTTMEWLLQEGNQIRIDAAATYDSNAVRTAGEKQCRYCKVNGTCAEAAAHNLSLVSLRFSDIEETIEWDDPAPVLPDFEEWTPERRSYVWLHKKAFIRWFDALHDHIMQEAKAGRPTPHLKVVAGDFGRRKFDPQVIKKAEVYLSDMLGEDVAVERKLITPAVAEKKLGKKIFREDLSKYVIQSEPKPKLVPVTDTREALPSALIQFDYIEEEPDEIEED